MLPATGLLRGLAIRALASDAARCVSTSAAVWQQQQSQKGKAPAKGGPPAAPPAKGPPPTAGGNDDFILTAFKDTMRQFRGMSAGLVKIPVPWDLDDKGIEKYIQDVEALKKKVGAPSFAEDMHAEMAHLFDELGQNWRKFIKVALDDEEIVEANKAAMADLESAVDEIERQTGKPLDFKNPEGQKMMDAKLKTFRTKWQGWQDMEAKHKEMAFERYKLALTAMKEEVLQEMEEVKQSLGLTDYKIDLAAIQQRVIAKAQ